MINHESVDLDPLDDWIQSIVGAPIQLGDELLGIINLDNAKRNSFTADHALRLQVFANQAAIAIQNAH